MSDAGLLAAALVIVGIGVVALVVMLRIAGDAPAAEGAKLKIEAVKYGLGVFAAAGAVVALLLGLRRQRLSEHNHELALEAQRLSERNHQLAMKAQTHTETDAAERRVTDLYGKAVEQLGSADAAVRLGGLYALERVAQSNPDQRQTIVNVLCAYLRMPYAPPTAASPPDTAEPVTTGLRSAPPQGSPASALTGSRDPHQEFQVRLTAQRILAAHLRLPDNVEPQDTGTLTPSPQLPFWPNIDLDLTGAALVNWVLDRCHIRTAVFTGAVFTGMARFTKTTFTGNARFSKATFTGDTTFDQVTFTGVGGFSAAAFIGYATFVGTTFTGEARFLGTTFNGKAMFVGTTFASRATFDGATFTDDAVFTKANFTNDTWFDKTAFTGAAMFAQSAFTGKAWFGGATFTGDATFTNVVLVGPALVHAQVASRKDRRDTWPSGWRLVRGPEVGRLVYEVGTGEAI